MKGMRCARTFENGSLPLIPLSISTLHLMLTTTALQPGAPKGTRSQVGKHLGPCYGFTENVHIPLPSGSHLSLTTSWFDSWFGEEYSQVCYPPSSCVPIKLIWSTSSVIIQDIKSMADAGSALLAYFYFDFKDTAKQDSRALLSSLLVQLSNQSDQLCDVLRRLYSEHQDGSQQPNNTSLLRCLKGMLTIAGPGPVYVVMDALDECPNDSGIPSSRVKVLKTVKELLDLRHLNLRLCVTSRPEYDIRTMLEPLATQQVSIHDECGQKQDIIDYVTSIVHSDEKMKRWRDDDKDMVVEKLTQKADGM